MKKEKHSPYATISNREAFNAKTRKLSYKAKLIYILMLIGLRPAMKRCGVFTDIFPQTIKRICKELSIEEINEAIDEIIDAGLIVYNKETGDLFVKDWWIRNMIAENPNMLLQYKYHLNSLFVGDENFKKLAEENYQQVEDRYNADRTAKQKNPNAPNENLSNLCFAAKIRTDFVWNLNFAKLSTYEQLTYLTLYMGPIKEGKAIGFYSNIDEYALADIIGGDVDESQVCEALISLADKGFIKYDKETFDVAVPEFISTNIYADSFVAWKYWFDMLTEYESNNDSFNKIFEKAVEDARLEMLEKHPGIKAQMESKGYTTTFKNKKRTYKFINGKVVATEEVRQFKYKKKTTDDEYEEIKEVVGIGVSNQNPSETIEQNPQIVKKMTNDDWMEMLKEASHQVEEVVEKVEKINSNNSEVAEIEEIVEKESKEDTELIRDCTDRKEVKFNPWTMITVEEYRGREVLAKMIDKMNDSKNVPEVKDVTEEEEAWRYYDDEEYTNEDIYTTHPEWD